MAGKRIAVFSLFALVALSLAMFASGGTEAGTYKSILRYSLSDYTAGANATTANLIDIGIPDYNYEDTSMFTFNPVDSGSSITALEAPIGAGMGDLDATSTIGISNGACASALNPVFEMYNATVETWDELSPADMYWVLKDKDDFPVPFADGDPNLPDYLEGYPHFLNEMFDPDGAGAKPPLQPRARYAGHVTNIANMNIIVQIVVFNPGQLSELPSTVIENQFVEALGPASVVVLNNPVSADNAPGAISDFCTPLNTTTSTYGTTTDNPATAADESGTVIQSNPAANKGVLASGTHIIRNYSRSERDADGDGLENDFDTCPFAPDPGWDPRSGTAIQPGADSDGDGIPDTCDPNPGAANNDEDGDGYLNKQDICPTVADGCFDTSGDCHISIYNPAWGNNADGDSEQTNADIGPGPDSIGDACDDSDNDGTEDGVGAAPGSGNCTNGIDDGDGDTLADMADPDCTGYEDELNPVVGSCWDNFDNDDDGNTDWDDPTCIATAKWLDNGELQYGTDPWGTNPSGGAFYHVLAWAAVCIPDTDDTDGDGYCDALETTLGSPINNGPETGTDCDNATDDDADTYVNDGCPMVGSHIERGTECLDAVSNDTPADSGEVTLGVRVNDGCPAIGVPESLVIDATITAGSALPSNTAPQSCSDGIDNDGDTLIDGLDLGSLACDSSPYTSGEDTLVPAVYCPADANCCDNETDDDGDTYVNDGCPQETGSSEATCDETDCTDGDGSPPWDLCDDDTDGKINDGCAQVDDSDYDGSPDNPADNCPSDWNPEQTDTDGDNNGDACDSDDDDDAYNDTVEWWIGTDPLGDCPATTGKHDAWPLDMDMTRDVSVTGDVWDYVGKIGCNLSSNLSCRRLDLDATGDISVTGDVFNYVGKIGQTCTYP